MIELTNMIDIHNRSISLNIESDNQFKLDGKNKYLLMPGLIDPHVHFRTPGAEYKENWLTGSKAAISGGICTVFDMPNTLPSTSTIKDLKAKKQRIDCQLNKAQINLNYELYFGATATNFDLFENIKKEVIGIKIYMGSSTGDLLVSEAEDLENIFKRAGELDIFIGVHAESEHCLQKMNQQYSKEFKVPNIQDHTMIRPRKSAIKATSQAIELAAKYNVRCGILHIGTKEEIELVKQAKKSGYRVYAEVTPNHLFLDDRGYISKQNYIKMNPPIRQKEDSKALWHALINGDIDWIGSDHAPHTIAEKNKNYVKAPSGIAGVETTLSLMLNQYLAGRISLVQIQLLMRENIETIFRLKNSKKSWLVIDLDSPHIFKKSDIQSKCGCSPFVGREFQAKLLHTIIAGQIYSF